MSVYPRDSRWFAPIVKRLDDHPRLHAYNMSIHPRDNHYLVTTVTTPNCHILLPCNNLNQFISYCAASLKRLIEYIYKQSFEQYLQHPVHDYTTVCSCVSAQTVHGMARAAGSQKTLKMIFFNAKFSRFSKLFKVEKFSKFSRFSKLSKVEKIPNFADFQN